MISRRPPQAFLYYLLLDERGFPLAVLEAKSEKFDPLAGKEQARKYARSQNIRFVILSNGNLHYFWDMEQGNPVIITGFPTLDSLGHFHAFKPNPDALVVEKVETDYVVITQNPCYRNDPRWNDLGQRDAFVKDAELKFLRPYQIRAIAALQDAVRNGGTRFLFEMATGTGKTLTAAAVIKLFMRTGNAKRVLFLVDRLELEDQAWKAFVRKKIDPAKINQRDPREWECRQLLDTYKTFGCESGAPTFRYSLMEGVREGCLLNPVVVDARTELLAEEGYSVMQEDEDGELVEQTFFGKDFEKKFFSDETNRIFCETFLKNALRDPLSGEIGKSIVFCVRQDHATRITKALNELADAMFPCKYNSDFAVQVTSLVTDAQQRAVRFANNNLNGHTRFIEGYVSAKTRVCVTVGMMTTGYDCEDLRNIVLLRPIFSPTDFIQIKGRGTRKFFEKFEDKVKAAPEVRERYERGDIKGAEEIVVASLFNKPEDFLNLDKLRKAVQLDRRVTLREILAKAFGEIDRFKTKDELLKDLSLANLPVGRQVCPKIPPLSKKEGSHGNQHLPSMGRNKGQKSAKLKLK
jgi:type I site-specific restriction endonuclease